LENGPWGQFSTSDALTLPAGRAFHGKLATLYFRADLFALVSGCASGLTLTVQSGFRNQGNIVRTVVLRCP